MHRVLVLALMSLLSTSCFLAVDDKTALVYDIALPDEFSDGTGIISENDAQRINASATTFDATGTRFEISSAVFTIVTTDELSDSDSVEFCFEDPIWVEPVGGERVEVAEAGLCVMSWQVNRLPDQ